jgi:hypothetical protein
MTGSFFTGWNHLSPFVQPLSILNRMLSNVLVVQLPSTVTTPSPPQSSFALKWMATRAFGLNGSLVSPHLHGATRVEAALAALAHRERDVLANFSVEVISFATDARPVKSGN